MKWPPSVWAFGRTKSVWSSKREYARKVEQPEAEVVTIQSEELRIVSDELYFAVQERLMSLKKGARGPKRRKIAHLWDLVTDCFFCAHCSTPGNAARFYQAGANGHGMRCKHGALCGALSVVRRKEAVVAVCERLRELLLQDGELVDRVIAGAVKLDSAGDPSVREEISQLDKQLAALSKKIEDLTEMAGEGSEQDRTRLKAKVREAQLKKGGLEVSRARLIKSLDDQEEPITADRARELLDDFTSLLAAAAAGELGEDIQSTSGALSPRMVTEFEASPLRNGVRLMSGRNFQTAVPADARRSRRGADNLNVRQAFQPPYRRTLRAGAVPTWGLRLADRSRRATWRLRDWLSTLLVLLTDLLVDLARPASSDGRNRAPAGNWRTEGLQSWSPLPDKRRHFR